MNRKINNRINQKKAADGLSKLTTVMQDVPGSSASHPRNSFVYVFKNFTDRLAEDENTLLLHTDETDCVMMRTDDACGPPNKHESASPLRRAEHPFGAEPTWSLRSQGRWPPPSSLRAAAESRESL